jgi:ribosomal peptide maturation radical SAM protein 1
MSHSKKNVLLISLPFAGTAIPSIQLALLESYLKKRNVNVKTRHLYLKAADFIGLNNYNHIIYAPNDSYTGQMTFSKYVFPNHWKKIENKLKTYFDENLVGEEEISKTFTFEKFVEATDKFFDWVIKEIDWEKYDIIGFTLNFGQFLPSLAISKKVKELYPNKTIVFGGSRSTGKLGKKILKIFDYVDFIVSGEGEEALYRLATDFENYESIPRLIYKRGNDFIWNKEDHVINLDELPLPDYDSFFDELENMSDETKKYFEIFGTLPIEDSRGCWWNKCTFCNMHLQHPIYRTKSVDKIIEEVKSLSEKYNILKFQFLGDTTPQKRDDFIKLFTKIKELRKDFTFFSEARADTLKSDDYTFLKEAGLKNLQVGIEAFSKNYLNKIKKGTGVIDNIATLKFCRENRVNLRYNIIVNWPNEEAIDYEETKENIKFIQEFLGPPKISFLTVGYGSPIYNNKDAYNIERLENTTIDKIMFPQEILDEGIAYLYYFKRKENLVEKPLDWHKLVKGWEDARKKQLEQKLYKPAVLPIDELTFYYEDGGKFVKIYDKRKTDIIKLYTLDDTEREIFLSCKDITTFDKILKKIPHLSSEKLTDILNKFEENGIVFRENNRYFSLPLNYSRAL